MRDFRRSNAAPVVALLSALLSCAAEKPPSPSQQAPMAATPIFGELLRTSARPMRQGSTLSFGEVSPLHACASAPNALALPPGGGLLLRFSAPAPTDLAVQLATSQGPVRVAAPEGLDDEDRLARAGRAYFYENDALLRSAPTGAVAPRELLVWPGERGGDLRFDLLVLDLSFAPGAVGAELQSAPLRVPVVGRCPDFALALLRDSITLHAGEVARIHARLTPSGDGVNSMTVTLEVTGAPPGVTVALNEPELTGAAWSSPRETAFLVNVGAGAQKGKAKLVLHARLGNVERTASLALTLLPKDDY